MKTAGLTVLFLTSLVLGATVSVDTVDAASNCTYYADAEHSSVVGQYGRDCCNNKIAWGVKSKFAECGGCFVCVPPPID